MTPEIAKAVAFLAVGGVLLFLIEFVFAKSSPNRRAGCIGLLPWAFILYGLYLLFFTVSGDFAQFFRTFLRRIRVP